MVKYTEFELEDDLKIGVSYNYIPLSESQDRDIPDIASEITINNIIIIEGFAFDLIQCVESSNGSFLEEIESKLLKIINDE